MSTKLTPHFSLEELTTTKTGISNIPHYNDINQLRILCRDILEPLREKLGCPLIVDSGFRSQAVNDAVGSVKTSQHLLGQAADIHCSLDIIFLYHTIADMVAKGIINVGQCILYRYSKFVHVSLPTKTLKNEFIIKNK